MNKSGKTRNSGGKLNRSEIVSLRLDPRLRYLTDLAARTQRRTTSGFIEWAIGESLKKIELSYDSDTDVHFTLDSESEWLWDVDEADRFIKLAGSYPNLLTHVEQILYKLIIENGFLFEYKGGALQTVEKQKLRKYWNDLKSVVNEDMSLSDLLTKIEGDKNG